MEAAGPHRLFGALIAVTIGTNKYYDTCQVLDLGCYDPRWRVASGRLPVGVTDLALATIGYTVQRMRGDAPCVCET